MSEQRKRAAGFGFRPAAGFIDDNNEFDSCDNHAFYFLTVMLILIVTFSFFKSEILHLIFSKLL